MSYTVKYRIKGSWFWRTLKSVKGDGYVIDTAGGMQTPMFVRWFILEDETRIEIPINSEFKFSNQRFLAIKQKIEAEVGQSIPVNSKLTK